MTSSGRPGSVGLMGVLTLVIAGWVGPASVGGQNARDLDIGRFSQLPEGETTFGGWQPLTFKNISRHTTYVPYRDGDRVVVKATSEASSSGLVREMRIDPREYPIVEWNWKVANVLNRGDVSRKEGDDYPARIYITFEYDATRVNILKRVQYEAIRIIYGRYPPLGAVNYIWESKAPVGSLVPNPYTDQVQMFVIESGPGRLNTWINERRNVYEDYKRAFGAEPPAISGVAIMTDTDNTGESATAYYGDITFHRK